MQPSFKAVVIGASAGALDALNALLPALPADGALAVMIVVHVPPDKQSMLTEIFGARCQMRVTEAEDKYPIEAGTIYFAPPNYHLLVEEDKFLSLSTEEPVLFSRPSIDILFETAADVYGEQLIGIILTGANNDGAAGLKAVVAAGGAALIQLPAEAYASAMPKAALEACPAAEVLSLAHIADYLQKAARA